MAKKDTIKGMSPFNSVTMAAQERKWRAEDDLRTLTRAREIRNDPARMKAVRTLAKEQLAAMAATKSEIDKK